LVRVHDLQTPALLVEEDALDHNLRTMAAACPGPRLRPHVKAHKCSGLARRQRAAGHAGFTCATPREMLGLAAAGLGEDLLLANEGVDARRLAALADAAARGARITIAVDSDATIDAAARAGLREVLIDVNVGLPRCGCAPEDAGRLAERARGAGLEVRGVMGYEGHAMIVPERAKRVAVVEESMRKLLAAHARTGGEIVSAGGTGTYDINPFATEIQAGSYVLLDTAYQKLGLPFRQALFVLATVVSVSPAYAVADCGLKSLGMDHGNPEVLGGKVWFCSDEHLTFAPDAPLRVGDHVRVVPAHVDPTLAYHERLHVVRGDDVLETLAIDLRGW
jgi:D-serine deaminase-like pyridoxal phosphate-dependent protein